MFNHVDRNHTKHTFNEIRLDEKKESKKASDLKAHRYKRTKLTSLCHSLPLINAKKKHNTVSSSANYFVFHFFSLHILLFQSVCSAEDCRLTFAAQVDE